MPSQGWDRREYDHERYLRIKKYLVDLLGGACMHCGSTAFDKLEFDHLEQETKLYAITSLWNRPNLLEAELKKCRLLCYDCHKDRTKAQMSVGHGEGKAGKRNCPCQPCRARKAEYMRARRAQRQTSATE